MRQNFPRLIAVFGLVAATAIAGCSSNSPANAGVTPTDTGSVTDAGPGDTGSTADAGTADAGTVDPCAKCTDNQTCTDKVCVDNKPPCGGKCATGKICDLKIDKCVTPSCKLPEAKTLIDNKNINKITKLSILSDKFGCDLNDDAAPDNVLGKVIGIYPGANKSLTKAVKDGSLVILLAPDAWKTDDSAFTADLLIGDVDPSTKGCDATAADACKYTVSESSYDQTFSGSGTCPAVVTFDPAKVNKDKLVAGGDKQIFELNLPVVGINLKLKISKAQISGTVTDATAWKDTKNGMLCGVISEKDLNAAIDAVPAAVLADTGFDKATIKKIISSVMKPDIDTDGDGVADAISVALGIETVAVPVTGYTAKL